MPIGPAQSRRTRLANSLTSRVALGIVCALPCQQCASNNRGTGHPTALSAQSQEAQHAFRRIHSAWIATPAGSRKSLEASLIEFITYHERDEKARLARLYLALVYIETGRTFRAQALIEAERKGPPGALLDLANVVHAAALARAGRSREALNVLLPMRKRIVDRYDRLLFSEVMVTAALNCERHALALEYMENWLTEATPQVVDSVKRVVAHLIEKVPAQDRERGLSRLSSSEESAGSRRQSARIWLRQLLHDSLVDKAITEKDSALAQRLLDAVRPRERRTEAHRLLSEVAEQIPVVPRVAGRSVGFVLSLGTSLSRRRSAEASRGLSRALGLPDSASDPNAVKLIARDESGGTVRAAMAGLASDGAAILVAGVDDRSADQARAYADSASIPVILLHPSTTPLKVGGNAFLLGVRRGEPEQALKRKLELLGRGSTVQVDAAQCERRAASAEQPRFDVSKWKAQRVDALVLLGDELCTRDVLREVSQFGFTPWMALGLESSHLRREVGQRYPTLNLSAGRFPGARTLGGEGPAATFYELLGYDAGQLITEALSDFPQRQVAEKAGVLRLHRLARSRLSSAQADLLTTQRKGFAGALVIERELSVQLLGVGDSP